jgi:MoxR-like ATPase
MISLYRPSESCNERSIGGISIILMVDIPPLYGVVYTTARGYQQTNRIQVPMFQRFVGERLALARLDTPVILLAGARQVGKSTLARAAARSAPGEPVRIQPDSRLTAPPERYVTLDDATIRAAAAADPQTFVDRYRFL